MAHHLFLWVIAIISLVAWTPMSLDVHSLPHTHTVKLAWDGLPSHLQTSAKRTLEGLPDEDHESISIDQNGKVWYTERVTLETNKRDLPEITKRDLEQSVSKVPVYHSRPGAPNVVYLDFDGESVSNSAWRSSTIVAEPYDIDGSPSTFSPQEIAIIHEIWQRVSEDYTSWNIDVTTERPSVFTSKTGHVIITYGDSSMPSGGAGGIAYIDVFGDSDYNFYRPAWVYYNNLGTYTAQPIAEATSHEFGHNLGLSHDGTTVIPSGQNQAEYYFGYGSGSTSWAPIMGAAYYKSVTQWSKGDYPNANNFQDDVAIITSKLGLVANPTNTFKKSSTSNCPTFLSGSGIVRSTTVPSQWTLKLAAASDVTIKAVPNLYKAGADLDINLSLYTSLNTLKATAAPNGDTSASITVKALPAGTYTIRVKSSGDTTTPYPTYASMGSYTITACVSTYTAQEIAVGAPIRVPSPTPSSNPSTTNLRPRLAIDPQNQPSQTSEGDTQTAEESTQTTEESTQTAEEMTSEGYSQTLEPIPSPDQE
jgi:hypothetical protein